MQSYKVLGLKKGSKFISGKSFEVIDGILTAMTDEDIGIIRGSNAYRQGNIVEISLSELSMDAASVLLQEKLTEISFFLTMDELQRLKNLPEPNKTEAIKVLKGNFYDVLEHYESTGVVHEDDENPPVIVHDEDILPDAGPGEQETLEGDFPPAELPIGNGDLPPKEEFVSKFSEENTVKELKAYLDQNEVTYDKTAKKEELLALAIHTESNLEHVPHNN